VPEKTYRFCELRMRWKILAAVLFALALAGCSPGPHKTKTSKMSASPGEYTLVGKYGYKRSRWRGQGPDPFAGKGSKMFEGNGPLPKGGGRYQLGKPYQIAGRWFRPSENPNYDKVGMASWYGEDFHSRKTSNGEYFDMNALTAAHPTLPLPSYAKVTNIANGKSIVVRINDRGPFVGNRIIDLSRRSADALDYRINGKAKVRVQFIEKAPLDDQGHHLMALNKALKDGANLPRLKNFASGNTVMVAQAAPKKAPRKSQRNPDPEIGSDETLLIQVGVFRNPDNAQIAVDRLADLGTPQVVGTKAKGMPAYRVQIGPFASMVEAEVALVQTQSEGYVDANIVRANIQQVSFTHKN
jgi:rare lipoprotein A